MIDWVTCCLPCTHDPEILRGGEVVSLTNDGELEWRTEKRLTIEGSFSAKITIKTNGGGSVLLSGNPVKFLQGHNVFGSNDLVGLVYALFRELMKKPELGLSPTAEELQLIESGIYDVTRVDVNETWLLRDQPQVLEFIRAIEATSTMKYRGRGQFSGDTLYFGLKSRRSTLKFYSKGLEIARKGHQIPLDLVTDELSDYAARALRVELQLRSLELAARGLKLAANWSKLVTTAILQEYIEKLDISEAVMLKDDVIQTLPNKLKPIYASWLHGEDMRTMMSRATYYRNRRELMQYGIDIAAKSPDKKTRVIPIIKTLTAEPAGIPYFALEQGLVFIPPQRNSVYSPRIEQ